MNEKKNSGTRDPLTGDRARIPSRQESELPAGGAAGAAARAAAGAAAGTASAGPIGTAVGAVAGAVIGGAAGRCRTQNSGCFRRLAYRDSRPPTISRPRSEKDGWGYRPAVFIARA